jgi:poly(rC)-binding protein 3/4
VYIAISFMQITGEVDSVRRGLNAVAEVLFAHPPKESDATSGSHPLGSSSHSLFNRSDGLPTGMQPDFHHIPFQGPSHANGPFDISDRRPNNAHFPMLPDAPVHGHAAVPVESLTFRLLCSKDKVGSIIGRGGNTVNSIQNDTGCEIKVLETVPKSEDRIIRISGPAVITSISLVRK